MEFTPRSAPQKAFLSSKADIVLYGGAAGSLKSFSMLVDAAQDVDNPLHHAILFRRTYTELETSLIMQAREIYPEFGGKYNESKREWQFPSGAIIRFGHCQRDAEIYNYMGAEYSYIGFDEATHFNEFPIRYMLSRLRSKDPSLRLKLRLATNPGSQGHVWIMKMFIGPTCFHCTPSPENRETFRVYSDARWPSDGEPVGLTTSFIPGKVSDHTIFGKDGERYAEKLKSLPAQYRKALLEGCWAQFEGQFFRCWDMARMVVPSNCLYRLNDKNEPVNYWEPGRPITPAYWWPRWTSLDWGFAGPEMGGSSSVAYLFTKAPNGVTYVLNEFITSRTKPTDLASTLKGMWYTEGAESPTIVASYLSPDAWARRTDERSIADQMSDYIGFTPASNDRIGGAMVLYAMLDSDQLKITSACPMLVATIPSRVHDDSDDGRRREDVKKTKDPYDDCLVAGTLITTKDGQKPIELIKEGDKILTRAGLKRVSRTIIRPNCDTIKVSGNINLEGTKDHKIWTTSGWKSLEKLQKTDYILKSSSTIWLNGGDIQTQNINTLDATFNEPLKKESNNSFIDRFGLISTIKQYHRNITSIIRMRTLITTALKTWFSYLAAFICLCMLKKIWNVKAKLIGCIVTLIRYAHLLLNGTNQKKATSGTKNTPYELSLVETTHENPRFVLFAENHIKALKEKADFAQTRVSLHTEDARAWTALKNYVKNVVHVFIAISMNQLELVPANVQLLYGGKKDVYDLTVEDIHEFFANDLLVANCYDSFRYGTYSHMGQAIKPREEQIRESITSKDPTMAMIQRALAESKFKHQDEPVSYNDREWRGGHN